MSAIHKKSKFDQNADFFIEEKGALDDLLATPYRKIL